MGSARAVLLQRRRHAVSEPPAPQPLAGRRVTLGVTGSISAYKSVEAARRLEDAGAIVDVALTPSAGASFQR